MNKGYSLTMLDLISEFLIGAISLGINGKTRKPMTMRKIKPLKRS